MKLDWLDAFLAFSESLNFTHAAEVLHISQPALHVKIRKLSESIGVPLYHKQGRQLFLTREGREIQAFAREIGERQHSFLAEIRNGTKTQPVKLAAGEGAYLYLLGPAIKELQTSAEHPISLISTDGPKTIDALLSGEAHVGVSAITSVPDEIRLTPLTVVNQVVVVPKNHRFSKKKTVRLSDLEDEDLILPTSGRPHRLAIEQALANQHISANIVIEANGWEVILHFVKLGLGISIVNSCCNIPATMIALPIPELPSLTYHILERIHGWHNPAGSQLKSTLLKYKDYWKDNKYG